MNDELFSDYSRGRQEILMCLAAHSQLACEQAHLFGRGASTNSWREEWGFTHTFPRFAGSWYK